MHVQAAALFVGHTPELVLLSAYIELARGKGRKPMLKLLADHNISFLIYTGNSAQALQIIRKTQPILS